VDGNPSHTDEELAAAVRNAKPVVDAEPWEKWW
jgi:hypothetical protein